MWLKCELPGGATEPQHLSTTTFFKDVFMDLSHGSVTLDRPMDSGGLKGVFAT